MAGEATARTQVPPPAGLAWVAGAGQLCGAGLVHRCRRCRGHPAGAPLPGPAWPTTEELTPLPLSVSWMRNKLKDI